MIKVGFVTKSLTDGNAQRGVGFYAKRLLPKLKEYSKEFGIEIFEIENSFQISLAERENLLDFKFQIIHYPYFDLFYHTLPIFKKTKTVVTIHDVIPLEFPDHYPPGLKGWLNLWLQGRALQSVKGVITDSYASVQAIRKYLLVPHEKLKLIYLAADEKFKPIKDKKKLLVIKNKYKLPDKFVLYVGDINWNKNIPNLIKACEHINYPLVIVGKQAAEIKKMDLNHPELRHLIDRKSYIINHVIRLGFVPDADLIAIYNLATVYCQPSFAEGFGLPVMEAMACGTQVAISNTHSLPEIAGEAAEYFDPQDVSDIVRAVKKAVNNKFDVISQAKKFSWEKTALDILRVYEEIL